MTVDNNTNRFQPKGKDDAEKALKLQQTKALNMAAYVVGLEKVSATVNKVEEIQQNPSKNNAKDLYEAKINMAVAETELEIFKRQYQADFGISLEL